MSQALNCIARIAVARKCAGCIAEDFCRSRSTPGSVTTPGNAPSAAIHSTSANGTPNAKANEFYELYRLRKNSFVASVLKRHDFGSADKLHRMSLLQHRILQSSKAPQNIPQGLKPIDFTALTYGLKPVPFKVCPSPMEFCKRLESLGFSLWDVFQLFLLVIRGFSAAC